MTSPSNISSSRAASWWSRWYRPIMYFAAFLAVLAGTLQKDPLELNVSKSTIGIYDAIENIPAERAAAIADLKEKIAGERADADPDTALIRDLEDRLARLRKHTNGVILICFDYDPGTAPELRPMAEAILHHAFRKDIAVLGNVGANVNSAQLAQDTITTVARRETDDFDRPVTGVDYVFLGYRPSPLILYMQMGENVIQAYESDYAGRDLNTLPMMEGVRDFNDIEMVVELTGYVGMPEIWLNVAKTKYNRTVGLGMTAVSAADYYPYIQSGQIAGLLSGLRGAAEYETAIDYPSRAVQRMRPQLYAHVLALALLLLGNGESLVARLRKPRR